jgi:hypothetical protein
MLLAKSITKNRMFILLYCMEMLIEVHTTKLYRNKQMNNDDNIFQFLDYVQVSVFQGFIQQ